MQVLFNEPFRSGSTIREVLQATVDCIALCEGERQSDPVQAERVLVSHQCVCLCSGGQLAGTSWDL